jgi:hypothetical protein
MMTRTRLFAWALLLAGGTATAVSTLAMPQSVKPAPAAPYDVTQMTLKLDIDIPQKLSLGKWAEADKTCTDIINRSREQVETPEIRTILIRAYEARGRARLNIKDQFEAAHEDFYNLLNIAPEHKLTPPVSDSEQLEYQKVQRAALGRVALSMDPVGTARLERIDGVSFGITLMLNQDPKPVDLVKGSYRVTATTPTGSYDQLDDVLTVTAGGQAQIKILKLIRRTSTLSVVSVPAGAEILIDDVSRGRTQAVEGGSKAAIGNLQPAADTKSALISARPSASFTVDDLKPEPHTLQIRMPCFKPVDVKFNIARQGEPRGDTLVAGDLTPDAFQRLLPSIAYDGAFRLQPAMASVQLQAPAVTGTLFLDGDRRTGVPTEPVTVCEGSHTIEVRAARGRFVDMRTWRSSEDEIKLPVQIRDAFAIANLPGGQNFTDVQRKALDAVKHGRALFYVPYEHELNEAAKDPGPAPDFWSPNPVDNISRDGRIERWRLLAEKLQAQGLAAISGDTNPDVVRLSLLAPGSSTPSVLSINTQDPTSLTAARDAMSAPLPSFSRHAAGLSVVDADHVQGAVIVRVLDGSAAAKAGLKAGSTIVRAGGTAINSVADWDAVLKKTPAGTDLVIDLRGPDTPGVKIAVGVAADPLSFVPSTATLRGSPLPANVALVDLQSVLARPDDAAMAQAAVVSLAIVHKQLGNWKQALKALEDVEAHATDGTMISAGTIAYLKGLCLEKLDRDAEAQSEFRKAAAARAARLDGTGPLVWPLAQVKLRAAK